MSTWRLCAGMLILLCACRLASGQGYIWIALTPEEAIQSVRAFEGNPLLALTMTDLPDPMPSNNHTSSQECYILESNGYTYFAGKYSASRMSRFDKSFDDYETYYGQPYDTAALAAQVRPVGELLAIATAFMNAHYAHPAILNGIETMPRTGALISGQATTFVKSYEFTFFQSLAGGARGPSACTVEVDAIRGKIVSYFSHYYPVLISVVPQLTPEQAVNAFFAQLNVAQGQPTALRMLGVSRPDALGVETLYYGFDFDGMMPGDRGVSHYIGSVDANTGEPLSYGIIHGTNDAKPKPGFLNWRRAPATAPRQVYKTCLLRQNGIDVKPAYTPLMIEGEPCLYVGYLCAGWAGVRMTYDASTRTVSLTGGNRSVALRALSVGWLLNGRRVMAKRSPILVHGRLYIPLEIAQRVLPFPLSFSKGENAVRFSTAAAPAGKASPRSVGAKL